MQAVLTAAGWRMSAAGGILTRRSVLRSAGAAAVPLVSLASAGCAGPGSGALVAPGKNSTTINFTTPGAARLADAWQPVLDMSNTTGSGVQLHFVPIEQVAGAGAVGQAGLAALDAGGGTNAASGGANRTYRDRLVAQLAGGGAPDVVALTVFDLLALQQAGALADLSAPAKARKPAELQMDDFWPEQVDACRVKGALYALPWHCDALLLYFNEALFQAKAMKSPRDLLGTGKWTWQAFLEAAQRIAGPAPAGLQDAIEAQRRAARAGRPGAAPGPGAQNGRQEAAPANGTAARAGAGALVYGTDQGAWETWVWSNGGEILDPPMTRSLLDAIPAVEALAFMAALATQHGVAPTPRELRGANERALFDAGRMGMFFDTRNAVPRLARQVDGTWDAVPVPAGKRGAVSRLDLMVFAVTSASKTPAEAFEAARFLTSAAAQRQWAKRGDTIPTRRSAAGSAEFLKFAGPTQATEKANASFVEAVQKNAVRLPPLLASWPELNQRVTRELRPLLSGERDAGAAARAAASALNQLLAGG